MQNKIRIVSMLVCAAMLLTTSLFAQTTSTKNTYSLYSMYGIGEMSTRGTLSMRSMGGAGVASRSASSINLLNPASYSIAIRQGILIDIGAEGAYINNVQNDGGSVSRSGYLSGTLNNISIQVPIAKIMGIGLSISPYSRVGYNINSYDDSFTDLGPIFYNYQGYGEITEVKLGLGVRVAKGLSIGVSAQYYWGLLDRYYSTTIYPMTSSISPSPMQAVSGTYVSTLKAQVGVQWDAITKGFSKLTIGATYDMGGNIAPEDDLLVTSSSSDYVAGLTSIDEITYPALYLPHQLTIGATYRDRKWNAAADYTFQKWGGDNDTELTTSGVALDYVNVSTVKLGVEYTPNKLDSRRYFRRAAYRAGARVGNYYQSFGGEILPQWALTAGVGLPINMFGLSNFDLGVEYGSLGMTKNVGGVNLVRQNYIKFSVGVTLFGDDYWFQRIKYD